MTSCVCIHVGMPMTVTILSGPDITLWLEVPVGLWAVFFFFFTTTTSGSSSLDRLDDEYDDDDDYDDRSTRRAHVYY